MSYPLLDLDISKSIKEYEIGINTKYISDVIYKLIELVKIYGKLIGINYSNVGDINEIIQYRFDIKYLNNILPIFFEFDYNSQYIYVIYYNIDKTKIYLKIFLSINDDPTIKYIENDYSGTIPSYCKENIKLKPGEFLINFAHCFLSYIGFNRARLDDDSYLITKDLTGNIIKTKLWLYYLITKNKSWYSKFGYIPGNTLNNEYSLMISDMKNIKLDDIQNCLTKILNADNKNLNPVLLDTCNKLSKIIGDSKITLYYYTMIHSLEDFTILTDNLTQSIFSKKMQIQTKNNPECVEIDFFWYDKYKALLLANVIQVNNNIKNYYLKI